MSAFNLSCLDYVSFLALLVLPKMQAPFNLFDKSMIRYCTSKFVSSLLTKQTRTFSEGAEFLNMVEKYFDKAGQHTNIRPDVLNFYKRADNVVKFNLCLTRGTFSLMKMMTPSRSYLLTDASIRLTNCPPKEERGMPRMLISLRSKPWPAL